MDVDPTEPLPAELPTSPLTIIRWARWTVLLFAAAIIACSFVAAYVGYELGAHRTNNQIAALNKARAASHANLLAGQKANTAQNERTRELVCDLLQRMPADPQINADRIANHCGPYLPPKSRPTITATTTSTTEPNPQPNPAPTMSRPKPTPIPTPTPGPPQTPTPSPSPPRLLCVLGICL